VLHGPKVIVILLAWAGAVLYGLWAFTTYENTPGKDEATYGDWPADAAFEPFTDASTLLLFVHPKCPCTMATAHELDRLLLEIQKPVHVIVYVFRPNNEEPGWMQSPTMDAISSIKGVTVRADTDGQQAARFGARTSGQAVLFDARGITRYRGGITESRGHEGDNDARNALVARINDPTLPFAHMPTFGCAILADSSQSPSPTTQAQ